MNQTEKRKPRRVGILRSVAFSIAILFAVFAAIEIVLRSLGVSARVDNPFFMLVRVYEYPEYFQKDQELFWRMRGNIRAGTEFLVEGDYRTNSLGLRGDEIPPKQANEIRIACFGNSCTFGWRLQEGETYPARLEQLLNAEPESQKYRVVNCGVPGYSSFQGLKMLKEYLPILQPDVVTICYGWNDHWAAGFDIPDSEQRTPPQWILDIQNLLSRLHTYRGVKFALLARSEKGREYTYDRSSPRYRVSINEFRDNLMEMVNYCRLNGATPVLITAPIGDADPATQSSLENFHFLYAEIVRHVADDMGTLLLDAEKLFRSRPEFYDDPRADFIHYNGSGARFLAERLARLLND